MFRTELNPEPSKEKISYNDTIITLGSCFAESIGSRLELNKFKVLPNPFGIIFNPLAQFKLLHFAVDNSRPEDYSYIHNQQIWSNYDLHSDFSAISREELELKIEGAIKQTNEALRSAKWLFLTFGTSIGYYLKSNDQMVANCHKVPAGHFDKKIVSQKQILIGFEKIYSSLKAFNPDIEIILTVSPVRHLKETLELNSVSKSTLRVAAHSMQTDFKDVSYFPAYELLLDDLRDYRFYARDMVHPNDVGEDYIWEKFCSVFFEKETMAIMKEWEKVHKSLGHKPFHSKSEPHQKFLETTLKQLNNLRDRIDVSREIEAIEKQLHS